MVYYHLAVATVRGNAQHVIKQHEDDKNGYGAWNALFEWYDGNAVKKKTAYYLRSELESYCLTSASNAAQYINDFLTSF